MEESDNFILRANTIGENWIYLFSAQQGVNSRADWFLTFGSKPA